MKILYSSILVLVLGMLSVISAADATGKWVAEMQGRNGNTMKVTYMFKVDGTTLTGTVSGRNGDTAIQNGKVDGDNISFEVTREMNGNSFTMKYTGKVSDDKLALSWSTPNGGTREVSATREK